MQYGDVSQMASAMKTQPIPGGKPARPPLQTQPPAALGPAVQGGLPPFLTAPSNRPGEETTQGLAGGPGAGPEVLNDQVPPTDPRELVLLFLSRAFGNKDAYAMRQRIVAERTQTQQSAANMGPQPLSDPTATPSLPDPGFPPPSMAMTGAAPQPDQPTGEAPVTEAPQAEAPVVEPPPAAPTPTEAEKPANG